MKNEKCNMHILKAHIARSYKMYLFFALLFRDESATFLSSFMIKLTLKIWSFQIFWKINIRSPSVYTKHQNTFIFDLVIDFLHRGNSIIYFLVIKLLSSTNWPSGTAQSDTDIELWNYVNIFLSHFPRVPKEYEKARRNEWKRMNDSHLWENNDTKRR